MRQISARLFAASLLAFMSGLPRVAAAQLPVPVLVEGISDQETWATTGRSNLLTRNGGRPAGLVRLQLWSAVEPIPKLMLFAQGQFETGDARAQSERFEAEADQFGIRYVPSRALVIDAGKLTPVVGAFAQRRFSNRNPLIGTPDGYSINYPLGVQVSGEARHFDYRAALLSLPPSHEGYVPTPTDRLRPAVGIGVTPFVGFRIGGSFTVGPYLNRDYTAAQLGAQPWDSYKQQVIAADVAFSRGYLETHAEAARATYEVPGRGSAIMGYTYYGEAKYTFTPRFFLAVRTERNKYPFIRASATAWTTRLTDFVDGEFGAGYRFTQSFLLKASVRGDRWWPAPYAPGFLGNGGPAFALQASEAFDVMSWFTRAR